MTVSSGSSRTVELETTAVSEPTDVTITAGFEGRTRKDRVTVEPASLKTLLIAGSTVRTIDPPADDSVFVPCAVELEGVAPPGGADVRIDFQGPVDDADFTPYLLRVEGTSLTPGHVDLTVPEGEPGVTFQLEVFPCSQTSAPCECNGHLQAHYLGETVRALLIVETCRDPSLVRGGTPFVRGDTNADGGIDVSDPVRILDTLFAGAADFACTAAADVNDDREVDVSDAITLLGYLFLGDTSPPPPFAECGTDSTGEPLSCGAFAPCV